MIFAKVRDWHKHEWLPTSDGHVQLRPDKLYPCDQPDELDDEEFNLVVNVNGDKLLMRSIDFDFCEGTKD